MNHLGKISISRLWYFFIVYILSIFCRVVSGFYTMRELRKPRFYYLCLGSDLDLNDLSYAIPGSREDTLEKHTFYYKHFSVV